MRNQRFKNFHLLCHAQNRLRDRDERIEKFNVKSGFSCSMASVWLIKFQFEPD